MIRRLEPLQDAQIFADAWEWVKEYPSWFRESDAIFDEPWSEYQQNIETELNYAVFSPEPVALIRLIETSPYLLAIHLEMKRGTDADTVLKHGIQLRDYLFLQGVQGFYGYIPTINRGVCSMYENLGFTDTGVRRFQGTIKGKLAEWKHYGIVNPKVIAERQKVV